MEQKYNRYNLEATFKKYLVAENISPQSLKQYLSDYRHFMNWLGFHISKMSPDKAISLSELNVLAYIDSVNYESYRKYLIESGTPSKTVNRRLSTLRKLSSLCLSQGWITGHPGDSISNVKSDANKTNDVSEEELVNAYSAAYKGKPADKYDELQIIKDFLSFINSQK